MLSLCSCVDDPLKYGVSYTLGCVEICVATNLDISSTLIEQARRVGKHKTKKEAVMAALNEYIRSKKQMRIFELRGKIDFDPEFDYRKARERH
jgi:hypothetical protein